MISKVMQAKEALILKEKTSDPPQKPLNYKDLPQYFAHSLFQPQYYAFI